MAVIYLSSQSEASLAAMLIKVVGNVPVMVYPNALGPLPAVPEQTFTAPDGSTATTPAKGVAGCFYLSINDPSVSDTMALPASVTVDAVNGQAVLGVWA